MADGTIKVTEALWSYHATKKQLLYAIGNRPYKVTHDRTAFYVYITLNHPAFTIERVLYSPICSKDDNNKFIVTGFELYDVSLLERQHA